MRFRFLAVFPLLYAAAFAAVASSLAGDDVADFTLWQRFLVRILAGIGCFAAVSGFQRGDHLRNAWLWLGGGTVSILTRDVLRLLPPFQPEIAGTWAEATLSALGILANVGLLVGIWMLAQSWRKAAIALPGGRAGAAAVGLASAALAVAVAGPAALTYARAVQGGDWSSLVLLVSAVVDIVSLGLIAPLLLTAMSMRGGLFSWPWGLITASQLSWLLYDAAALMGLEPTAGAFPLPDLCRALGETSLFAAGLAQLLVVRQVRRGALAPMEPQAVPEASLSRS